jgi:cytoskeletal protein CcmA (bactofilin family)
MSVVNRLSTAYLAVRNPLFSLYEDRVESGASDDSRDIGYFGNYWDGSHVIYTGLYRNYNDVDGDGHQYYTLFDGLQDAPNQETGVVDEEGTGFRYANLRIKNIAGANGNFSGGLDVKGDSTFEAKLNVQGAADFDSTVNIDGAATLQSTLDVKGDATMEAKLNVQGAADFDSTVNIDGAATLQSTLDVKGDATMEAKLNVQGAADFDSTVNIDGAADFKSTINVEGNAEFKADVLIKGDLTVEGDFIAPPNPIEAMTVTASHTLTAEEIKAHAVVYVNAAENCTITLPALGSLSLSDLAYRFTIVNVSANQVTVASDVANNIEGDASYVFHHQWDKQTIISSPFNSWIIE